MTKVIFFMLYQSLENILINYKMDVDIWCPIA